MCSALIKALTRFFPISPPNSLTDLALSQSCKFNTGSDALLRLWGETPHKSLAPGQDGNVSEGGLLSDGGFLST